MPPLGKQQHIIVIEEASLELVPPALWKHRSCRLVESRFGLPPKNQLLDDNFHHELLQDLDSSEKRGRPDVVHFALLDITSTPLYVESRVRVIIHTLQDRSIFLKAGVRLPRTLHRFEGLISKLISDETTSEVEHFLQKEKQSLQDLITETKPSEVVAFSKKGRLRKLKELVEEKTSSESVMWIIGGFSHGHFAYAADVCDELVSISPFSLPSHVVSARLCYELEQLSS